MPVFFEGALKICVYKTFESNEGETVEYFEMYFVDPSETNVLRVTSKKDLRKEIDKSGVVELNMQKDGKPKFISFKVR